MTTIIIYFLLFFNTAIMLWLCFRIGKIEKINLELQGKLLVYLRYKTWDEQNVKLHFPDYFDIIYQKLNDRSSSRDGKTATEL